VRQYARNETEREKQCAIDDSRVESQTAKPVESAQSIEISLRCVLVRTNKESFTYRFINPRLRKPIILDNSIG